MTTNPQDDAFPSSVDPGTTNGLTKLEYFASAQLAALISGWQRTSPEERLPGRELAAAAVKTARYLVDALNAPQTTLLDQPATAPGAKTDSLRPVSPSSNISDPVAPKGASAPATLPDSSEPVPAQPARFPKRTPPASETRSNTTG